MRAKNLVNHELTATLDRPPGKEKVGAAAQVKGWDAAVVSAYCTVCTRTAALCVVIVFCICSCDQNGGPGTRGAFVLLGARRRPRSEDARGRTTGGRLEWLGCWAVHDRVREVMGGAQNVFVYEYEFLLVGN